MTRETEDVSATPDSDQTAAPGAAEATAGQVTNWQGVLDRFIPRLESIGFTEADVPSPDDQDAFPSFLARVQVKDPLLASDISRTVRQFRDQGALPNASAQAKRERARAVRRAATMREVDGRLVKDKRKAPLYGLAALLLVLGPLGYFLARPTLKPGGEKKEVATTEVSTTPEKSTQNGNGTGESGTPGIVKSAENAANQVGRTVASGTQQIVTASQQLGGMAGTLPSESTASSNTAGAGSGADTNTYTNGLDSGRSSSTPPTVAPPPVVSTSPPTTRSTPAPDVYAPVAVTPATRTPSFGDGVSLSTSTPEPVSIPQTTAAVTPSASTSTSTPLNSTGADVRLSPVTATPATATSIPVVPRTATATATGTRARESSGVTGGVTAPVVVPASVGNRTSPAQTSAPASGSQQGAGTGRAFGETVTPPAGLSSLGTVSSEADTTPEPRRAVTSGLVYERKRPDAPTQAVAVSASTPAPAAANTTSSAAASTALFGEATDTQAAAPSPSASASEQPFGSDANVPASRLGALGPFRNLQQLPVRLVTAIYTLTGGSVPVVVVTADGGSFVGVGTINGQLARVDMSFRRYVAPDGTVSDVDALAYTVEGNNLTQGVPAKMTPVAPTLALDAAQNGASALQAALAAALNTSSTAPVVSVGDGASISTNALPPLWQIVAGGVGKTFTLPQTSQSIVRAAKVETSTPMTLIVGLGGN